MHTIWKADLPNYPSELLVNVPDGAVFMGCREQGPGRIAVWFRCDTGQPAVQRKLMVTHSGLPGAVPSSARYIGTAMFDDGTTACHVFEVPN